MPGGVVVSIEEGAPQGGPLSPLLSNIVLDELDWEMARRGYRFVRYADDANIYVRSERAGKRVMASITQFIERRLRLKVNQKKSAVARPENRHFVGFSLLRQEDDGEIKVFLSLRSRLHIRQRIRELTPRAWGQSLDDCIQRLNQYLVGWFHFFSICTSESWTFNLLDKHIRRRLRVIVLKQWRRKRTIVKRLRKHGVTANSARSIYAGNRSVWALSASGAVHKGLSNEYFAKRGLVSLSRKWRAFRESSSQKTGSS